MIVYRGFAARPSVLLLNAFGVFMLPTQNNIEPVFRLILASFAPLRFKASRASNIGLSRSEKDFSLCRDVLRPLLLI
ncbi:hypothetical protein DCC62_12605, partial [candidate division KSB1 bacterium]